MADDDAEAREEVHEDEAAEAPPVPSDEVAAALVAQFPDGVFVESHGQPVVYVPREQWHDVAVLPARRAAVHPVRRRVRGRPPGRARTRRSTGRRRRALRSGRQLPVAPAQPAHPCDRAVAGRRPDRRVDHRPLPGGQLRRARDLRPLRRRLHRAPRPHPHPHARRLGRSPAAQGRRAGARARSPSRATRVRDDDRAEELRRRARRGRRHRPPRARGARARPRRAPARGADRRRRAAAPSARRRLAHPGARADGRAVARRRRHDDPQHGARSTRPPTACCAS